MDTQNAIILQHIKREGSISALEAIHLYGVTRLAARILELRDSGVTIVVIMIETTSRTGRKTKAARYFLFQDY